MNNDSAMRSGKHGIQHNTITETGPCFHDDVIKWKHFPRYWLLLGEFTGDRWIPRTKASDAELWCFLWSASEPTVEQTMETLVIWDAIALIMTPQLCQCKDNLSTNRDFHYKDKTVTHGDKTIPDSAEPRLELFYPPLHWNGNVFILMKFSSLAALKVVKMTTSSAASDEHFVKMTTFSFQWIRRRYRSTTSRCSGFL